MRISAKDQIAQLKTDKKLVVELTKRLDKAKTKADEWKAKYTEINELYAGDVKISLNCDSLPNNYVTVEHLKSTGEVLVNWHSQDNGIRLDGDSAIKLLEYLMEHVLVEE